MAEFAGVAFFVKKEDFEKAVEIIEEVDTKPYCVQDPVISLLDVPGASAEKVEFPGYAFLSIPESLWGGEDAEQALAKEGIPFVAVGEAGPEWGPFITVHVPGVTEDQQRAIPRISLPMLDYNNGFVFYVPVTFDATGVLTIQVHHDDFHLFLKGLQTFFQGYEVKDLIAVFSQSYAGIQPDEND